MLCKHFHPCPFKLKKDYQNKELYIYGNICRNMYIC